MKALLVGLGSIGRRHLLNLRALVPDADITVWRQQASPGQDAAALVEANQTVYRLEDALAHQPNIALIASPASMHINTARALAEHNIHLFIEKPLSNTLDGVDALLEICHARNLVLMVGYNFRFCRPLQIMHDALLAGRIGQMLVLRAEVGQYLPDWRPGVDYRYSVSARRELGGGAVLELSHELDYARWLAGEIEMVSAQTARLAYLDIDVEDTAEITLRFANSAMGNVHVDMIQRTPTRACRIIGSKGTLTWDGMSNQVQLFTVDTKRWEDLHPATTLDRNLMYIDELRHFLGCVNDGAAPIVNGEDGKRVLEIALAAKQSAQEQRVIKL